VRLRLARHVLELEPWRRPLVMGIVNASPESFSDGASVGSLDDQVRRALALREEGADLIDVGGESGVSDRPAVSADEEATRVVPLVERLAAEGLIVSVDTWKPAVARDAIAAGAALVNDVSGLRDPGLADACAESGAGLVVMHTRAEPKVKSFPEYRDVMADVLAFLRERIEIARSRGVGEDQIVVDPGPDFAKTPAETIEVLGSLDALHDLGRPILLAASRKDFIGAITGRSPGDRLGGTLAAIGAGADAGVAIVRVHDVRETVDFLRVRAALKGEEDLPGDLHLPTKLRRSG
jgi:dihydropteroate synthase